MITTYGIPKAKIKMKGLRSLFLIPVHAFNSKMKIQVDPFEMGKTVLSKKLKFENSSLA